MAPSRSRAERAALSVILVTCTAVSPAAADHLLVTTSDFAAGNLASVALSAPWSSSTDLEAVGPIAVARHWGGLHWIVNGTPLDAVQVIDPVTWETVRTLTFEPGADPHDIVVAGGQAYVSLHARPFVLVIDPASGAPLDSIDVSAFADADGIPDLSRMEVHAGRLFVQVQRLAGGAPVAPSFLVVIDMAQDTVVGSVTLTGLHPVNDMQIDGGRLYVVEHGSGEIIDPEGGVEAIDPTSLTALGFVTTEMQLGGDTDCFVLTSPTKGYAVTHTDLTLSSHLTAFSRVDGAFLGEVLYTVGARTDQLAHDPFTGLLYFPANADEDPGIRVVDVATDSVLTPASIPTGLPPRDVLVVRGSGPTGAPVLAKGTEGLRLGLASPNPFGGWTDVPFALGAPAAVTVTVFDVAGRRVLARPRADFGAGEHLLRWDGRDGAGRSVAGTYFVRVEAGGAAKARTVTLVRR
jgi:hypothetical protein